MLLLRFLLRFAVIPLGFAAASSAVALAVVVVSWGRFLDLVRADADDGTAVVALVLSAPTVFLLLWLSASAMMLPAVLAVALAEIAAIRSWLYYAASGALAAWIGWWMLGEFRSDTALFDDPALMAGAGVVGGLVYWAVAGWNAGFWKPVFGGASSPAPPAA